MKILIPTLIIASFVILVSCRGSDNKSTETAAPIEKIKPDSDQKKPVERVRVQEPIAPKSAKPNTPPAPIPKNKPNEILANIDKYLVSSAQFNASAAGGIADGTVTVQNTLTDITFQKVLVEASILKDNGEEYRTDYYTVINIEPGETKIVRIPKAAQGTKVVTHIVKVKSDQLTNGELVIVGSKAIPK